MLALSPKLIQREPVISRREPENSGTGEDKREPVISMREPENSGLGDGFNRGG